MIILEKQKKNKYVQLRRQYIQVNGQEKLKMELENKYGPMDHIMKDNGKIIYQMEMEYLLKKMVTNQMASGFKEERMDTLHIFKIINQMVLSKIHTAGNG